MYEIWRQRNPESRMYMDVKKLMNQKNYIIKHNRIMEIEIEEIKRELQASQRRRLEEREEEVLENLGTKWDGEKKHLQQKKKWGFINIGIRVTN